MALPGGTKALLLAALAVVAASGTARGGDTASVQASLTVLTTQNCRFTTASATLDFGTLVPPAAADALATATIVMRCNGGPPLATYAITDDDGMHETGGNANRMRTAAAPFAYLPYQLTYAPATDTIPRNTNHTITLTGRILAATINAAQAGTFADTVTLSLLP